jgi:hypothetical protein
MRRVEAWETTRGTSDCRRRSRRAVEAVLGAAVGVAVWGGSALLAAQGVDSFGSREEITAVDLLVELTERRRDGSLAPVPRPRRLAADELRLTLDGEPRDILAVEGGRGGAAEPWITVLYFDVPLAGSAAVRWAARELAVRLPELTALGAVSIVVADSEPEVHQAVVDTEDGGPKGPGLARAAVLFGLDGSGVRDEALACPEASAGGQELGEHAVRALVFGRG